MERGRTIAALSSPRLISRISRALLMAILPVAVLASHVYVDFHRVRQRLVRTPLAADTAAVAVPIPAIPELSDEAVALVADVRNDRPEPLSLRVLVDGEEVAAASIGGGRRTRVDAAIRGVSGTRGVTIAADRAGWTLVTLEVANVHGFTDEPFDLVVAPAARRAGPAPAGALVALMAGLVALAIRSRTPAPRWRWWRRAGAAFSIVLFGSVLLADRFTPFAILLSVRTFGLLVLLLYAGPVAGVSLAALRAGRRHWQAARVWLPAHPRLRRPLAVSTALQRRVRPILPHLLVIAAMLAGVSRFWEPGIGLTKLVLFGDQFADRTVPALRSIPHAVEINASGYDGQFYAQLAFDPLLRDPATIAALDNAAYRGRRVLFPAIAYVFGLGRPPWVLSAYAYLNVVSWVLFAVLLWAWLPPGTARALAAWIGCLLGNGWIASLRLSLTDGPSVLVIALAVYAVERGRANLGAGALALAVLGRETSALSAPILLPARLRGTRLSDLLRLGATVAPFALWVLYLRSFGLTDVGMQSNVNTWPFAGFVDKWTVTASELAAEGWSSWARVSLVAMVGMTVQALFFAARWRRHSAWWRIGAVHAAFMCFLGSAVWEGYPGAATRAMLPMAIAFNIELLGTRRSFWPLWVLGNLSVATSSEFIPIPFIGSLI